ncbi:MAG: hypothetical protein IPN60_15375 [Saprospiraceae bacterium]|nr:hypothetical protein [Candidatus Opimibacter skivensis]MBL0008377.1 hypothetical protein [Candidatus Opimibacter skivensis]
MRNWVVIIVITAACIGSLSAQSENVQKYFIGGYYTFLIDPVYIEETSDSINFVSQYLNVNFRYALNRAWRVGAEYIMTFTSTDEVDDPFSTVGLTIDYDILRAKRSKLHLRAGLSFSNFSVRTEGLPQKTFIVNRILGGSYEYRISNVLWLYGGLYHHFPLNKIEFKDAMVQPFIGVCIGM